MSDSPRAVWMHRPWAIQQPALNQIFHTFARTGGASPDALAPGDRAPVAPEAGSLALGGAAGGADGGGIAVIALTGVITPWRSYMGPGLMAFRQQLARAVRDPDVQAIVIDVDSPGGMVSLVPETAAEVFAARQVKPVIAVANTLAASAAYWIAAQATTLVMTPSGDVGSVGVYQLHQDWSAWNEKQGIDPTFIHAAPFKVEGNMEEPLGDGAKAHIQSEVDEIYGEFLAAVAQGRGVSVATVKADYGEGRTLSAARAKAAGMVDAVMTLEQAIGMALIVGSEAASTAKAVAGDRVAAALATVAEAEASAADAADELTPPPEGEPAQAAPLDAEQRALAVDLLFS